jgi:phosphatidylglycerol---prolipoprotein diacylglyceryl transferase
MRPFQSVQSEWIGVKLYKLKIEVIYMNPIAFYVLGLPIRWYGILISLGILAALSLAAYTSKIKAINYDELINAFLIAFPAAIVGARLYYVAFEFENYADNLRGIFNIREGGLAIHGGVLFGLGAAYLYLRYRKENFLKYADVAAPSIILAQAIGRWGNFFNQEAHGGPVTYEFMKIFPKFIRKGMYIEGAFYHPTFLYESIWNLVCCLILLLLLKRTKREGNVIFSYVGLYSIGRFFIEGLRTDSLMLGGIRVAQLISILGIVLWLGYLVYSEVKAKSSQ